MVASSDYLAYYQGRFRLKPSREILLSFGANTYGVSKVDIPRGSEIDYASLLRSMSDNVVSEEEFSGRFSLTSSNNLSKMFVRCRVKKVPDTAPKWSNAYYILSTLEKNTPLRECVLQSFEERGISHNLVEETLQRSAVGISANEIHKEFQSRLDTTISWAKDIINESARLSFEVIEAHLKGNSRIANINVGYSNLTDILRREYPRSEIFSPRQHWDSLETADAEQRNLYQFSLDQFRPEKPYRDSSFDSCILVDALHLCPPRLLVKTLEEYWRALKLGGKIIIVESCLFDARKKHTSAIYNLPQRYQKFVYSCANFFTYHFLLNAPLAKKSYHHPLPWWKRTLEDIGFKSERIDFLPYPSHKLYNWPKSVLVFSKV